MGWLDWLKGGDEVGKLADQLSSSSQKLEELLRVWQGRKSVPYSLKKKTIQELTSLDALADKFVGLGSGRDVDFTKKPDFKNMILRIERLYKAHKGEALVSKAVNWIKSVTSKEFLDGLRQELKNPPYQYVMTPDKGIQTRRYFEYPNEEPSGSEEPEAEPAENTGLPEGATMPKDYPFKPYRHAPVPKKQPWVPYFYSEPHSQEQRATWMSKAKSDLRQDLVNAVRDNAKLLPPDLQNLVGGLMREISTRATQKVAFKVEDLYEARKADIRRIFQDFFNKVLGDRYQKELPRLKPFEDAVFGQMEQVWNKEFEEVPADVPKPQPPETPVVSVAPEAKPPVEEPVEAPGISVMPEQKPVPPPEQKPIAQPSVIKRPKWGGEPEKFFRKKDNEVPLGVKEKS